MNALNIVNRNLPFKDSADFIRKKFGDTKYKAAIVLGSGLGSLLDYLDQEDFILTEQIQSYPPSTVEGHSGKISKAHINGKNLLVFSGRVHYYEGGSPHDAAATSLLSFHLGIDTIILTNASGILYDRFYPGDLMMITDHINFTFVDIVKELNLVNKKIAPIYSPTFFPAAWEAAKVAGVQLKSGVYAGVTGPSYETAAEVKMLRLLGGDAVGMSTIHEATIARYLGMQVFGLSCLTNYSTGLTASRLSHSEVNEIGRKVSNDFSKFMIEFIKRI
ncbi:MAG: purine-nucleoside phosphorylase [Candidatus Kryptoniota bacterium]